MEQYCFLKNECLSPKVGPTKVAPTELVLTLMIYIFLKICKKVPSNIEAILDNRTLEIQRNFGTDLVSTIAFCYRICPLARGKCQRGNRSDARNVSDAKIDRMLGQIENVLLFIENEMLSRFPLWILQ